ncbi:hypothetical protein D5F01_LYC05669 [Larimichthys crocea]|uniref:Uncharacterized protein n=1 Tax=Larimichthys crocea TaxID=215358 RepID=A0A6G0IU23_LARCR|nr:hypothetical protein D5F01_LYC05669 [Larimichthys crocea]
MTYDRPEPCPVCAVCRAPRRLCPPPHMSAVNFMFSSNIHGANLDPELSARSSALCPEQDAVPPAVCGPPPLNEHTLPAADPLIPARSGTLLTLLRICPDVDTFRMSFCGLPGSCSGSLSDDSSRHRAAADSGPPASAILPSDPRGGPGEAAPPSGGDPAAAGGRCEGRLVTSGGQSVTLQEPRGSDRRSRSSEEVQKFRGGPVAVQKSRGGPEEVQKFRGGPEVQRRSRGGSEVQRRSRSGLEEVQKRSGSSKVQRRSRGGSEEVQKRFRGAPEEVQRKFQWGSRRGPEVQCPEIQRSSRRGSVAIQRRSRSSLSSSEEVQGGPEIQRRFRSLEEVQRFRGGPEEVR